MFRISRSAGGALLGVRDDRALLLRGGAHDHHSNGGDENADKREVQGGLHDLRDRAADQTEHHAGNDAGRRDEVLIAQAVAEEHRAGQRRRRIGVGIGQPVERVRPDEAHQQRDGHEHGRQHTRDRDHLTVGDVRVDGGDDIAGDIGDGSLHAGGSRGHQRCKDERRKQRHDAGGQLAHEPRRGAVGDLCNVERAEREAHVDSPDKAQQGQGCGENEGLVDLLLFLDGADALEVDLVGHAAGQNSKNPEHAGRHTDIIGDGAREAEHGRVDRVEVADDIGDAAAHDRNEHNADDAHGDHEAGEDEVRPCDGLQAGRHDKRQREHGKQHAQQRVVNAGQVGVDIAEGRDLGGHPAERHKDRHNTGDDADELISVREVRKHIGNGGEVVAAQPLGKHHNDDKRQRRQHAIDEMADAAGIRIADMRHQNAAAHCAGKLRADDDIKRKAAVCDLPVGLSGLFASGDDVGRD